MSALRRLASAALVFAMIAGLVHILTTFWLAQPEPAPRIVKLSKNLPVNQLTVLDALRPDNQPVAFMMPEAHYAVCPFDLRRNPLRISAWLPDRGWIFSLHTLTGDGFYFAPGSSAQPITIELNLLPPGEPLNGLELAARIEDMQIANVIAPDTRGVAVIRASLRGKAYAARVLPELLRTNCRPVGRPILRASRRNRAETQ